jgi:hypothetical protein
MSIIPSLFVAVCCVAVAAWLWTLFAAVAMTWIVWNSGGAFSRGTSWNPMNALLVPQLLTERGLLFRRHVGYGASVFIVCLAIAGLMALVTFLAR